MCKGEAVVGFIVLYVQHHVGHHEVGKGHSLSWSSFLVGKKLKIWQARSSCLFWTCGRLEIGLLFRMKCCPH